MPRVLITSRQNDADAIMRRLERDLIDTFGYDNVLTDYIRHQPGLDVRGELARRLTHSHALLVVIGRFWEHDPQLRHPQDTVRLCLELGLQAHGLHILPILVEGAVMPTPDSLPTTLSAFASLRPFNLREKPDYDVDLERLISTLQTYALGDKTYGSTPARLETFTKPPADFSSMSVASPPPPPRYDQQNPPIAPPSATIRAGVTGFVFTLIAKAFANLGNFFFSLIATALRQMVSSVVSFVMGIVLMVLSVVILGALGYSLLSPDMDLQQLVSQVLEQINAIANQVPQNIPPPQ